MVLHITNQYEFPKIYTLRFYDFFLDDMDFEVDIFPFHHNPRSIRFFESFNFTFSQHQHKIDFFQYSLVINVFETENALANTFEIVAALSLKNEYYKSQNDF